MLQGLTGIAGLLALAWLSSEARRAVPWRAIVAGLVLQIILALTLLKLPGVNEAFLNLNNFLNSIEKATQAGTSLVFGYLGGGSTPFAVTDASSNFVLAFRALPIVLLMSALSALLFYWGILQWVVRGIIRPTYALCGFANFGSLGIMIGGMSAMCPPRRAEIVDRRRHACDLPYRRDRRVDRLEAEMAIPEDVERYVARKFAGPERQDALALLEAATIHDGSNQPISNDT